MSDWITCRECGEKYDGHSNHDCPGSPDDRLARLENRVTELEDELAELKRGETEPDPGPTDAEALHIASLKETRGA